MKNKKILYVSSEVLPYQAETEIAQEDNCVSLRPVMETSTNAAISCMR